MDRAKPRPNTEATVATSERQRTCRSRARVSVMYSDALSEATAEARSGAMSMSHTHRFMAFMNRPAPIGAVPARRAA